MTPVASHRATSNPAPTRRHYARAPVIESSIGIQAERTAPVSLDDLKNFGLSEAARYPEEEALEGHDPEIIQGPDNAEQRQVGWWRSGTSERFQARIDGLVYEKLEPYTAWEQCRDEATRLWEKYRTVGLPPRVTRLSLRYVNVLRIPAGAEIKDYLLTAPDVAPRLPQSVSGYVMQLTIPHPELPAGALVIREAIIPSTKPDSTAVLLEILLFQQVDFAGDSPDVWKRLELIHSLHNDAFESSITDLTREIIS